MDTEIGKQLKCVMCDKKMESSQDGWQFNKFSICYDCVERIFKDVI